jgi:hypothetical protein
MGQQWVRVHFLSKGKVEMKDIVVSMMVAVIAVAVVWSSPSLAEEAMKGRGMNMPAFADFDLNGDGKMTEEEFNKARSERIAKRAKEGRKMKNLANAPSFSDIDTDDDGSVSPEEFAAHQAEHHSKMHKKKH